VFQALFSITYGDFEGGKKEPVTDLVRSIDNIAVQGGFTTIQLFVLANTEAIPVSYPTEAEVWPSRV
jgi:hypothetical protein